MSGRRPPPAARSARGPPPPAKRTVPSYMRGTKSATARGAKKEDKKKAGASDGGLDLMAMINARTKAAAAAPAPAVPSSLPPSLKPTGPPPSLPSRGAPPSIPSRPQSAAPVLPSPSSSSPSAAAGPTGSSMDRLNRMLNSRGAPPALPTTSRPSLSDAAMEAEELKSSVADLPQMPVTPSPAYSPKRVDSFLADMESTGDASVLEYKIAKSGKPRKPADNAKLQAHRLQVWKEVISTEETYVKGMLTLMQNFLQPLQTSGIMNKDGKTSSSLGTFLGCTAAIAILHAKFLKDLKKKRDDYASAADDSELGPALLHVFESFVLSFKCYVPYIQAYPSLNLEFDDPSKALSDFLNKAANSSKQSVSSLLILPVQRIPRYLLLLAEVDANLTVQHPLIKPLQEVSTKLSAVASRLNECQRESENSAFLFKFHTLISSIPDDWRVLSPSHEYLGDTQVLKQKARLPADPSPPKAGAKGTVRIVLFDDVLCVCDNNWRYLERLDLASVEVRPKHDLCFEVFTGLYGEAYSHTMVFSSSQERNDWMSKVMMAKHQRTKLRQKLAKRGATSSAAKKSTPSSDSASGAGGQEQSTKINVFMRIRPFVTPEEKEKNEVCLTVEGKTASLKQSEKSRRADRIGQYDHIFPRNSRQSEVFDVVGRESLGAIFAGYSIAIIAYGNTGAGKTYTMFGDMSATHGKRASVTPSLQWQVGDNCWAQWSDGNWYLAVIEAIKEGKVYVMFPEYYESACVTVSQLQPLYPQQAEEQQQRVEESKVDETQGAGEADEEDPDKKGLIPRILNWLFNVLADGQFEDAQVSISYLQVYNNELHDLQSTGELKDLPLSRNKSGGYDVKDLLETKISSMAEAMAIIERGNSRRVTRSHKMNEMSSRSHALVILNISFLQGKQRTKSQLYLVDLAGSEAEQVIAKSSKASLAHSKLDRVARELVEAEHAVFKEESKHINQSLISLGRCVAVLIENQLKTKNKRKPVPFRESKLTHLLQQPLSGAFLCTLILNASPSPAHDQVTLTAKTMAFGEGFMKLDVKAKKSKVKEEKKVDAFFRGVWKAVSRKH